jgi:hypothetical protein
LDLRIGVNVSQKEVSRWILTATNSLKILYLLSISKFGPIGSEKEISKFILSCLEVYKFSANIPTDSGDDASILSVMALLRLRNKGQQRYVISPRCNFEFCMPQNDFSNPSIH